MFTTFFIVDCFNNAMMFITHPMSKALTLVIGIFALLLGITLLRARHYAQTRGLIREDLATELCLSYLLFIVFFVTLLFYVADVKDPDRLIYTQRVIKNILMFMVLVTFSASIVTIRLQRKIFARKHHIRRSNYVPKESNA